MPGSNYVYAGGSDGRLHEIDVSVGPTTTSIVLGDGSAVVGAPSLDRGYDLVHVGTEAGVFYAVDTPLPPGPMCVDDSTCLSNVGMSCYIASPALCDGSCTCRTAGTCAGNCCDMTNQPCSY